MDQDSTYMVAASKVPMLKPSEYELWRMRMEQYIQMVDYSLWEVIENDNKPLVTTVVEGVIEKKFGGNAATKKTQRNLLKQQYENFTAFMTSAQWSGFCWGMMVEVCGTSREWWKLSRNVGKWRLQVGGNSWMNSGLSKRGGRTG
nr:hypothetical protein [Tanacetum cinerariifolium]